MENETYTFTVFVVYKCGGEWDRYNEFTGASTNIKDLKPGWDLFPH